MRWMRNSHSTQADAARGHEAEGAKHGTCERSHTDAGVLWSRGVQVGCRHLEYSFSITAKARIEYTMKRRHKTECAVP